MANDLAEIARAVAEALRLFGPTNDPWYGDGWHSHDQWLVKDGSNLTDPYWRCRCEDWLLSQGIGFTANADGATHVAWMYGTEDVGVNCLWAEAPARLVAAVWRKQNER